MSLGPSHLPGSLVGLVEVASLAATGLVSALTALLIDVFAILILSEGVLDTIDDFPSAAALATPVE